MVTVNCKLKVTLISGFLLVVRLIATVFFKVSILAFVGTSDILSCTNVQAKLFFSKRF